MYDELLLEEEQVVPAETGGWAGVPDERDEATKKFDRQQEMLRREAEAQKTLAERHAEAQEEEANKAADAARVAQSFASMYGELYGVVKRPGGTWRTASEHYADEREHRQRARRSRGLVSLQAARQELGEQRRDKGRRPAPANRAGGTGAAVSLAHTAHRRPATTQTLRVAPPGTI